MIHDNLRKYRKAKGLSQEEMAVKLHVVRQTVSKWEKGLSVPDAEVLMNIAAILDVPVSRLLGIEAEKSNGSDLSRELARVNKQLAEKSRKEVLVKRANEKRGLILLLSFISLFVSLHVKNPVVSAVLSGGCILWAVFVLYRNLALMTSATTDDLRLKVLRMTTAVNIGILGFGIVLSGLTAAGVLTFSKHNEKMFAMFLIACIMVFAGVVSPRLPFTKHTGLRLPWTVQDRDTWDLAHRIVGYISLPLALLYVACALTIEPFEMVTLIAMLLWIGIPGGISYVFFWKKGHGRL